MALPEIVTREEWLAARKELLAKEKELTRAATRSAPSAASCRWSRSTRTTSSRARTARRGLLDLFEGRRQLIVAALHVRPELGRRLPELHGRRRRDLATACSRTCARATRRSPSSRARRSPSSRRYKAQQGLDLPLVLVVRQRLQLRLPRHPRRLGRAGRVQLPRRRDELEATGRATRRGSSSRSSSRARAASCATATASSTPTRRSPAAPSGSAARTTFLDLTALGRQEEWEEPKGRADDVRGAIPDFAS